MNRFLITAANLEKTKLFLAGKLNKSSSPRYAQKYGDQLTVSQKGRILFEGKPLIPREAVDKFFRTAVYQRGSKIPLSRDGGFAALGKLAWGLRRRAWFKFLMSQEKLRSTDRAPAESKKGGRPAKNLFYFETDLMEVRTSQMPLTLKNIKNSYILTTVHRTSSLAKLDWIASKQPKTATGALLKALDWFSERLNIPVSSMIIVSDAGHEISTTMLAKRKVKHIVQKLGASVESRNGVIRRQLFKILNLKRGGFKSSLSQTQEIINNLKSRVHNKTPNEVAKLDEKTIIDQFNSKRQKASNLNRTVLKVGDTVRRTLRNKKSVMYKSNEGSWDPKKYTILGVSRNTPKLYRIRVTEKVKNITKTKMKWIPRDRLQLVPKTDDAVSARLLKNRLQSGAIKKKPTPRPKKQPPPLRAKSTREGAKKGIEKRRAAEKKYS